MVFNLNSIRTKIEIYNLFYNKYIKILISYQHSYNTTLLNYINITMNIN